jgi:hypothetical protein
LGRHEERREKERSEQQARINEGRWKESRAHLQFYASAFDYASAERRSGWRPWTLHLFGGAEAAAAPPLPGLPPPTPVAAAALLLRFPPGTPGALPSELWSRRRRFDLVESASLLAMRSIIFNLQHSQSVQSCAMTWIDVSQFSRALGMDRSKRTSEDTPQSDCWLLGSFVHWRDVLELN